MKTDNKMGRLYQRLKEFGIDRSYVIKSVFPEGWLDAEASNPAVYSQALILLSRNLNLDMRALQPENAPLSWRPCSKTLFKGGKNADPQDFGSAERLSVRATQVACGGMSHELKPFPKSGSEIRASIIGKGEPCVHFETQLDFCWNSGVPVLHASQFPEKGAKNLQLSSAALRDDRQLF